MAVEDLFTSELPARADYQNRFERLRDRSHTRALPLSGLLGLFAARRLEVERVQTDVLVPSLERWLANAHTPPDDADEVRRLLEADERDDLSGCRPFRRDGELAFHQRTAILVGRTLG